MMNIKILSISCSIFLLLSCNNREEQRIIKAEYAKGDIEVHCNCETGDWQSTLPVEESFSICFDGKSMVIFSDGERKILLPKKGKTCYNYAEIVEEFDRKDEEVTQDYFSYYLKAISKKQKEEEVTAMVSRGNPLAMISPGESCSMWKDSVSFEWATNLEATDSIIFMLWKAGDTLVYQDTIPAVPSELKLAKSDYKLEDGSSYTWLAFLSGMGRPDAMDFNMADAEAMAKYKAEVEKTKAELDEYPAYIIDNLIAAKSEEGGFCN